MKIVLDASAVVKWFVREEESGEMEELLGKFLSGEVEFHSPELLLVELANVLRYARGLTPEDVARAVEAVRALGVNLVDDLQVLGEAIELAFQRDVTVYDALYVSLAQRLSGRLVTYDGKLLRKFGGLAATASELLGSPSPRD